MIFVGFVVFVVSSSPDMVGANVARGGVPTGALRWSSFSSGYKQVESCIGLQWDGASLFAVAPCQPTRGQANDLSGLRR